MRRSTSRAIIPLKPKNGLTRISCTRHQARATCAAFLKESCMKSINANRLHRKSGGMGHSAFVTGMAKLWAVALLLQNGFCQVAWMVHIDPVLDRQLVGNQLQGNDLQHGG
jgi:hypothetical protein